MADFFTALEAELHEAAARRPLPRIDLRLVLTTAAAVALVATAAVVAAIVLGGGDVRSGQAVDEPQLPSPGPVQGEPRHERVVARGRTAGVGRWKIAVSRTPGARDTRGGLMWGPGWCVWLTLQRQPDGVRPAAAGFCGSPRNLGFRRTPGFSRFQMDVPGRRPGHVVLVWGRVPGRAARVTISAPGRAPITVAPSDGLKGFPGRFYVIPLRGRLPGARINWIGADGTPGSAGIRLMPPITR